LILEIARLPSGAHFLVGTSYSACTVIDFNPLKSLSCWPSILEACIPTISRLRVPSCFSSGITPYNTETSQVSSVIRDDLSMHLTTATTQVGRAIPLFDFDKLTPETVYALDRICHETQLCFAPDAQGLLYSGACPFHPI
jgi:hypothetical protein